MQYLQDTVQQKWLTNNVCYEMIEEENRML